MSDISQIDGQSVRLKRESMGWALTDMATLACLSVKQIKQIEEGGTSAFYSESVKLTAARKVAALLDMTDTQLFGQHIPAAADPVEVPTTVNASLAQSVFAVPEQSPGTVVDTPHASLMRSEALHVLAQPPEHIESAHPEAVEQPNGQTELAEQQEAAPVSTEAVPTDKETPSSPASGGSYMLKIFALFLVALAVAAFLRPKATDEKPEQDAVSPPPVQVPVANENAGNAAQSQPVASGAAANLPGTADKPEAPTSVNADKAALPAAADKPMPATDKPVPSAVNPATNPGK